MSTEPITPSDDGRAFAHLEIAEQRIVLQAMRFVLLTDHVSDCEAEGRLAMSKETLADLLRGRMPLDDLGDDGDAALAVNNCLNEVCHGARIPWDEWPLWFEVEKPEVERIYRTWARLRGWTHTGVR